MLDQAAALKQKEADLHQKNDEIHQKEDEIRHRDDILHLRDAELSDKNEDLCRRDVRLLLTAAELQCMEDELKLKDVYLQKNTSELQQSKEQIIHMEERLQTLQVHITSCYTLESVNGLKQGLIDRRRRERVCNYVTINIQTVSIFSTFRKTGYRLPHMPRQSMTALRAQMVLYGSTPYVCSF